MQNIERMSYMVAQVLAQICTQGSIRGVKLYLNVYRLLMLTFGTTIQRTRAHTTSKVHAVRTNTSNSGSGMAHVVLSGVSARQDQLLIYLIFHSSLFYV